jgi:NADH-quinone oxidoreductase subunit K
MPEARAMDEAALLHGYLIVGAVLFGIGVIGFMSRRNLIVMFLAVEMMLQGVSLSLVAWGRFHNNWDGQMLVIFILAVAACEAAIALALVLMLFRSKGNLDAIAWQSLREANQPEFSEEEETVSLPEDKPIWPKLTPSGVEPEHVAEEEDYRSRV